MLLTIERGPPNVSGPPDDGTFETGTTVAGLPGPPPLVRNTAVLGLTVVVTFK